MRGGCGSFFALSVVSLAVSLSVGFGSVFILVPGARADAYADALRDNSPSSCTDGIGQSYTTDDLNAAAAMNDTAKRTYDVAHTACTTDPNVEMKSACSPLIPSGDGLMMLCQIDLDNFSDDPISLDLNQFRVESRFSTVVPDPSLTANITTDLDTLTDPEDLAPSDTLHALVGFEFSEPITEPSLVLSWHPTTENGISLEQSSVPRIFINGHDITLLRLAGIAVQPTSTPVPTSTPRPTLTPTPTPQSEQIVTATGLSPEEQSYVQAVDPINSRFGAAYNDAVALVQSPQPADLAWRAQFEQDIAIVNQAVIDLNSLTPPASLQQVHDESLAGYLDMSAGLQSLYEGITESDDTKLITAKGHFESGARHFQTATALLKVITPGP